MSRRRWAKWAGAIVALGVLGACGSSDGELPPLRAQDAPPSTVHVDEAAAVADPFGTGAAGGALGVDTAPTSPTTATSTSETTAAVESSAPDESGAPPSSQADIETASTTTTSLAPPTSTSPPGTFTIVATGDLMGHIPTVDRAQANAGGSGYDFRPMFRVVEPTIAAADVAICHLEGPIVPPGEEVDPLPPQFAIPTEMVQGIASAGYDRCSLASNHTMDQGVAGIEATVGAFEANGLGHAGMARTPAEREPTMFDVRGVQVAHLSYTFSYNGRPAANGEAWRSNLIDPDRIIADAQAAREGGAEFVILSVHWGVEGGTDVLPTQRQVAEEITASGAVDVIVGHHAHVIQPIEEVNGRWVVYGMGNFLTAMSDSTDCCGIRGQDGEMVRLTVTQQPDGTFTVARPEVIPTYVDRSDYTILPVNAALAGEVSSGAVGTDALTASLERTTSVVGPYIVPR